METHFVTSYRAMPIDDIDDKSYKMEVKSSRNLLYKAEKPSVRLSVCLRHGIISVVSAWIDLGLGLCIAESFET